MYLDVGNRERIDDPTDDQILDRLRNLPPTAPFASLNADEDLYLQTTPQAGGYRVELRQEARSRFAILSLGQVEVLFLAFRRWDEAAIESVAWRRLTLWNDPYRRGWVVLAVLVVLTTASGVLSLW